MWEGHEYRYREIFTAISELNSVIRAQVPPEGEDFFQAYKEELLLAAERLSNYSQAAIKDSRILLNRLHSISRYSESVSYRHDIQYCISDYFNFDAFAQIISPQEAQIVISLGVFLAIEDLFLRLAANMDFYSFDPNKEGKRQWHGCDCLWFAGGIWSPHTRYYDYRISQDLTETVEINSVRINHLFAFHASIPFESQRLILSSFMVDVGILWILMHEEAHYTEGHLAFLESQFGAVFSKQKLSEINQGSEDVNEISLDLRKAMEFQADCVAAQSVVDIFCREEYLNLVPAYCEDRSTWFLRLLLVAIGSVILVLQKAHSIHGSSENYPSPLTRLTTIFRYVLGRVKDTKKLAYRLFVHMSEIEFNGAVTGALDDLQTVSSLLTREKNIEKLVEGEAPIFQKTHDLGILDEFDKGEIEFLSLLLSLDPILLAFMLNTQNDSPEQEESINLWIENQRNSGSQEIEVPAFMVKTLMKTQNNFPEKHFDIDIDNFFQSLQYSGANDRERLFDVFRAWFLEYFSMEKHCFDLKLKTASLIPIKKL
jgi:hypothetical protein